VSKSVPNPNGSYSDVSRDFSAQGLANTAVGFFQGMPIGGTMSETAVNVKAGAQSRWANVFSGIFIIVAVMVFGSLIEYLAMPAIAALLIVAGYEAIKPANIKEVWFTGWAPRLIMVATLAATLILPVQQAVFLGVVLATLQYIYSASVDVNIVELKALGSDSFEELSVPSQLAPRQVVVLQVYGSLFYAAAAQIERLLPTVQDAEGAVLILRLRGVQQVGSTFVNIVERYAAKLHGEGGDLLLAEVTEPVYAQFLRTETVALVGEESVFMAEPDLFAATRKALAVAEALVQAETRNHSKAAR
jgi:sulfate permease, SulP family